MSEKTRARFGAEDEGSETTSGLGVAVIGLGAVGSSLARSLYRSKYRLVALIHTSVSAAADVAKETGGPIVSTAVADIPEEARLLFVCTREHAIPAVVNDLLAAGLNLEHAVVAHVSGRETAAVLLPLAKRGAQILSFHPLGSFPPRRAGKTFTGLTIGLEGDPLAVAVGKTVALDLGAVPVEIPAAAKAAYHLAAAITSNFLVALFSDVERLLAAADLPSGLTYSLALDTLENLRASSPEHALTGPIARADKTALEEQIRTLADVAPDLLSRFAVLAESTIELAQHGGRISSDEAASLKEILETAFKP